jgi:hypothetical protein
LRASILDRITGPVEIQVALADPTTVQPQAVVNLISTWIRAVGLGFFGPARINLQGEIETRGERIAATVQCEQVSPTAFRVLARLIQYFSRMTGKVKHFDIVYEGQPVVAARGPLVPALPKSLPFVVEYPEDLKRYVRVEIEFRLALKPVERDAIFAAFSVWDVLIEALAGKEWWGQQRDPDSQSEYESRLLSPAIVEHQVDGYFAPFACLHFIVWLGLRVHSRLVIDRLTME